MNGPDVDKHVLHTLRSMFQWEPRDRPSPNIQTLTLKYEISARGARKEEYI